MKARWLTLFACLPLIAGITLLQSCGGVGGPNGSQTYAGSNAPTQNFLALLTPSQKAAKYIGPEACGASTCHGGAPSAHVAGHLASATIGHAKPTSGVGQYATWKQTLHAQKGVTCESCHGPGSVHQAQPKATDGTANAILTFPKVTSVEVCGQCHGPQHDEFNVSKHSQLITSPISSTVTGPTTSGQASQCFVCHGGLTRAQYTENGILPAQMTSTQIVNVANDILNTVPNVASCATCHNPHAKTGNLTGKGKEVQLYHPEALTDSSGIVAGQPVTKFAYVNQICAQCHNGRATNGTDAYLQTSTSRSSAHHSDQFNSLLGVGGNESASGPPIRSGTHAQAPGQCATCHMPGSRHTMTVSYDGCAPCHTTTDAAARASSLQAEILGDLTTLETRMANWSQKTFGDPSFWDYTSNIAAGKTPPNQTLIPIEVKRARHNYYYVVISGDLGIHNPAYTRYLLQWSATNLTNAGIPKVNPSEISRIPVAEQLKHFKALRKQAAAVSAE